MAVDDSVSLSQLISWETTHLTAAADSWDRTADRWEDSFTAVNTESAAPAGRAWEGVAADSALRRTYADRIHVVAAADSPRQTAQVARTGADLVAAARTRLATTVDAAACAGFEVDDDLSVWDTRPATTAAVRQSRNTQGLAFASDIRAQATDLVATDRQVASRLRTVAAGFQMFDFPASPEPSQPPPAPVPMERYVPKTWAACKLRGADPNKVVRTFNRAPLSAGFRTLPGGDSQLYCGNDKFGFLHIANRHGEDWARKGGLGSGNWRYLADYAMGATLAYPEDVQYNQSNDTFIVERNMYPTDGDGQVVGPALWKTRVIVSAADGKIITANPISVKAK